MKVSGQCPVQGFGIRGGWLFYFRARDGWELRAWAPGNWAVPDGASEMLKAKHWPCSDPAEIAVCYQLLIARVSPTIVVDENDEGKQGSPDLPDGENTYEGWWSHEYATAVAEWAIAEAMKRGAEVGQ